MLLQREENKELTSNVEYFLRNTLKTSLLTGLVLLAINENVQIVGTVSLIEHNKGGFRYVSHDNLAVSSLCKGKGVATNLF